MLSLLWHLVGFLLGLYLIHTIQGSKLQIISFIVVCLLIFAMPW